MINVGVDIDGSLDQNPEVYASILTSWNGKRYLLTARPTTEGILTYKQLISWGIHEKEHYDELIMYPYPYLFEYDEGTPKFWSDDNSIVFRDLAHRYESLECSKKAGAKELNCEIMFKNIASWKVNVCKKFGISAMFEDSLINSELMKQEGIYVFNVERNFKKEM